MAVYLRRKRLVIAAVVSALLAPAGWFVGGSIRTWYRHREVGAALARRDFPAARERMRRCLRSAPADPEFLLLAAQIARRDGDPGEASRLLRRAADADADRDAVRMERRLGRLQSGDLGEADKAFVLCRDSPSMPDVSLILEALVIGSLRSMRLSLARQSIDLWRRHHTDTPARVQGLVWSGEESLRRGGHDRALAHFREALELDPDDHQARRHAVEILVRVDPCEALTHLGRLLRTHPDDSGLLMLLARCRRCLGDHEEARHLLDTLLAAAPDGVDVLLERGRVELDLRNTDQAERWFRRAEALAPERREPNLALARCLQVAGRDADARQYRRRVERIDAEMQKRIDALFTPPADK